MEIKNYHQEAEVSGVTSSKFGFEMNAKMYDILISKMYTNKQGAVIRELSANAWDAHVDAGKKDTPFDIGLPTWLDKSFYIRDYGTGIPHDKFEFIYTNVGASTKEGTNDLIGGFGLGSKTPFTMTDTFMVENWHNGIKTTWVCFKDKGEPQVSKVGEEPSDEPSGLKVSFTFDEGDVKEFTTQITKQLRFFPVKPNVTGGEGQIKFPELPKDWDTKDYFYLNEVDGDGRSWYAYDNYVIMGNVAYKVDSSSFGYEFSNLFNGGLCIKVNIGDVDIPPSREHLELTTRTKQCITGKLREIRDSYKKDIQHKIDQCTNEWELRKLLPTINTGIISNISNSFTWKGTFLKDLDIRAVTKVCGYPVVHVMTHYKNPLRNSLLHNTTIANKETKYYVYDLDNKGGATHFKENYRSAKDVSRWSNVIIFKPSYNKKSKDDVVSKAIKELEDYTGETIGKVSDLVGHVPDKPKTTKTTTVKKETPQVYKWTATRLDDLGMQGSLTEVNTSTIDKEGYYIELNNWSFVNTGGVKFKELLDLGVQEFLDKPVYIVRTKYIPKLPSGIKKLTKDTLETLVPRVKEEYEIVYKKRTHLETISHPTKDEYNVIKALGSKSMLKYIRYCKLTTLGFKDHFYYSSRIDTLSNLHFYLTDNKGLDSIKVERNLRVKKLKDEFLTKVTIIRKAIQSYSSQVRTQNAKDFISLILETR